MGEPKSRMEKFQSSFTNIGKEFIEGLKTITLEPIIFFAAVVWGLTTVVGNQLLVEKSCYQDMNYTAEICDNILNKTYKNELALIQDHVSQFKVYSGWIKNIFPAIISLYYGSWSDSFGRKWVLYMFFVARLMEAGLKFLNAYYIDWPKEYLLLADVPAALCGGWYCFFMSFYAVVANIASLERRRTRLAILTFMDGIGVPVGTQIGKYIYRDGSYNSLYGAALIGRVIALLMLIAIMETIRFRPALKHSVDKLEPTEEAHNPLNPRHAWDTLKSIFKKRPNGLRFLIITYMIVNVGKMVPIWGEIVVEFNFVMTRFGWGVDEYSDYSTVTQIINIAGQAIMIPILGFIDVKDTTLVPFLVTAITVKEIIKAFSTEGWMFYLAAALSLGQAYIFAASRSIISKCVEPNELGKVYSILSVFQATSPLWINQIFASIWAATSLLEGPGLGSVYLFSAGLIGIALVLSIIALIKLKGRDIAELNENLAMELAERSERKALKEEGTAI